MEPHKRLFQIVAHLLVCILLHSTFLLASATALQDLPGHIVSRSLRPTAGRYLLQDTNTTITDDGHRNLPVASIVVGVVAAALAVFFVALTTIGFFQNRWEAKVVDGKQHAYDCEGPASGAPPFMITSAPEKFSYKELQSGTLDFTEKLGRGGRVFKGVLSNTTDVAVKRLVDFPGSEFEQDVKKVAGLQNGSLVRLFGYCSEGDHRLLVYEYLAKGSLSNYLYASSRSEFSRNVLNWVTRFRIALHTAKVLSYVHDCCSGDEGLKVHGRIHPENILLTENCDPKLADFGFSRPTGGGRDQAPMPVTNAADTMNEYFAPEWWAADRPTPVSGSWLTPKSDVYSFGILMLEIVSGRRIGDIYKSMPAWEFPNLAHVFGKGEEEPSGITELVDPGLESFVDIMQLRVALHVAYWCIQSEAEARPTMAKVVGYLEGREEMESPPTPSSSVVFAPIRHNSQGTSLQGFRFGRRPHHVEIVNAR